MKITRTVRVNGEESVGVAKVNFNFEYSGENPPVQINVNSSHTEGGVTSNLYRTYSKIDGVVAYNPVQSNPSYPFDITFNDDLMVIMEDVFENYNTIQSN